MVINCRRNSEGREKVLRENMTRKPNSSGGRKTPLIKDAAMDRNPENVWPKS